MVLRKRECGLTFDNIQNIINNCFNPNFIEMGDIAGLSISIDSPWYPFEFNINEIKDTECAQCLFSSIFLNSSFEVFHLKLVSRYTIVDNRCAVNLTNKESTYLGEFISKSTNIKVLYLEFIGLEGALGITEFACLEIVYGILKSNIKCLFIRIKGNKKNSFNLRNNREVKRILELLKKSRNIETLKLFYE